MIGTFNIKITPMDRGYAISAQTDDGFVINTVFPEEQMQCLVGQVLNDRIAVGSFAPGEVMPLQGAHCIEATVTQ